MRLVIFVLLLLGISFGEVSDKEYEKDKRYIEKLEKRLEVLDRKATKEGATDEIVGELNSYGYPLYKLKDKYLLSDKHHKFYERVERAYQKILYIKRGLFAEVIAREAKDIKLPLCDVSIEGKDRETLRISIKDPKDEKSLMKLMTQTQLQNAQVIGIRGINFEKCD